MTASSAASGPGASRPRKSSQDACPGTLRLHQAEDGGLARVRVPGGMLSSAQLRALGTASAELGDGCLELTSRANVQLRGLSGSAGAELADRIGAAGLLPSPQHERMRNILASPLSGRDGGGLLDIRALTRDLDRAVCADPDLAALSGRFLFAVDDGRADVASLGADVGILAVSDTTVAILVAGADSGLRLPVEAAVPALTAAATAFLALAAQHPDPVWRVAELPNGDRRIVERLCTEFDVEVSANQAPLVPAGRGPVGWIEQPDGRVSVAVVAPLARLSLQQTEILAYAAELGSGALCLTPWRGVVVFDLDPDTAEQVCVVCASAGLLLDATAPGIGVTACAGKPRCAKALRDVRTDAAAMVSRRGAMPDGALPVHWAGCSRGCGRPKGRVVDVVATEEGYRVLVGGQVRGEDGDVAAVSAMVTEVRKEER